MRDSSTPWIPTANTFTSMIFGRKTKRLGRFGSSSIQLLEFGLYQGGQRLNCVRRKIEATAGSGKKIGQCAGAAEREGGLIIAQGFGWIAFGICPHLERAELRDAVFDVVKRI